jgi:hypothetical protein
MYELESVVDLHPLPKWLKALDRLL